MAGGKETPRQKMIGMMYLVLTALLALQVSSAIILKFKFLDDSLMHVNRETTKENDGVVSGIKSIVAKEGNRPKDVVVLNKADEVRKKSHELLTYMNEIREKLINDSGGREPDGNYKGAKEEEKVAGYMVGIEGKHNGEAYKFKAKLNEYAAFLTKEADVNVPPLAKDGKEDDAYKNDKEQRNKDFAQLNFSETPMVAALAVLAQKQAEVLKFEAEALAKLASQVGADKLNFDKILAMVRPASKVVAAGTKYEAELFLAASSNAVIPTMKFEGREVPVKDGKGQISFTATPGAYDKDGNAKKVWKGSITMKNKGQDTTFAVSEEYIVARPVISVQSASVSALYRNCGNELNIQVPALGSTYNPSFTASGAQVIKGTEKGKVTLVPTGAKVTINVASNGNAIGSQDFAVRLIPKPTIECLSNGAPVNEKQGMAAPGPRSITMRAVPDESFKTFLPKDARYRITQWEAILVRGKRPVSTQAATSETANLQQFAAQAQPGDRILIEVKKVQRTNFLNQVEDVNLGVTIKNIPLN